MMFVRHMVHKDELQVIMMATTVQGAKSRVCSGRAYDDCITFSFQAVKGIKRASYVKAKYDYWIPFEGDDGVEETAEEFQLRSQAVKIDYHGGAWKKSHIRAEDFFPIDGAFPFHNENVTVPHYCMFPSRSSFLTCLLLQGCHNGLLIPTFFTLKTSRKLW